MDPIATLAARLLRVETQQNSMNDMIGSLLNRVCRLENLEHTCTKGLEGDGAEDKLAMVSNRLSVLETQMEAVLRNKAMDFETNQPNGNEVNCDGSGDEADTFLERVQDDNAVIKSERMESVDCEENVTVRIKEKVKLTGNGMVSMMKSVKISSPAGGGIADVDSTSSPRAKNDQAKQNACKITCSSGHPWGKVHARSAFCPSCTELAVTSYECGHEATAVCHLAKILRRIKCAFCSGLDRRILQLLAYQLRQRKKAMKCSPPESYGLKEMMNIVNLIDLSYIMNEIQRNIEAYGTSFCADAAEIMYSKIVTDAAPIEPSVGVQLLTSLSSEDSSTFKILVNKLIFMTSSRFREMYRRKSEPKRSGTESIYDEEHGSRLIWLVGKLFSVGALSSVLIMEFIDRLSDSPLAKNAELLCYLLEMVGTKLHSCVDRPARNAAFPNQSPSSDWLRNVYIRLIRTSVEIPFSVILHNRVMNVLLAEISRCSDASWLSDEDFFTFTTFMETRSKLLPVSSHPKIDAEAPGDSSLVDESPQSGEFNDEPVTPSQESEDADLMFAKRLLSGRVVRFPSEKLQNLLHEYVQLVDSTKKKLRLEWIREKFAGITGDDLNEFLREFPYYMLVVRKPGELAGGAHLLHDVIDAGLTRKSFVIDGFAKGVVEDITSQIDSAPTQSSIEVLSYVLVELFIPDSNLNWLIQLGRNAAESHWKGWYKLSVRIIDMARARFKKRVKAWNKKWKSTGSGKEIICNTLASTKLRF